MCEIIEMPFFPIIIPLGIEAISITIARLVISIHGNYD